MESVKVRFFGKSVKGKRSNNEDAYLCKQLTPNTYTFAVADGMGGTNSGEIASHTAIEAVNEYFQNHIHDDIPENNIKNIVQSCFYYVQDRISYLISEKPELSGMGTTLTLVLVVNDKFVYGNIGDSRIYRINANQIELLTRDHTYIQQLIDDNKQVTIEDYHRFSHMLTKCINGNQEKPDIFPSASEYHILNKQDCLLLCSDGLIVQNNNNLSGLPCEISVKNNVNKIVNKLINRALQKGSNDNITAVVIKTKKTRKKIKTTHYLWFFIIFAFFASVFMMTKTQDGMKDKIQHIQWTSLIKKRNEPAPVKSWYPLDVHDKYTKSPDSYLIWHPYPRLEDIKKYQILIKDTTNKIISQKWINRKKRSLGMSTIKGIEYGKTYILTVNVKLINDSLFRGNSTFLYTNKRKMLIEDDTLQIIDSTQNSNL